MNVQSSFTVSLLFNVILCALVLVMFFRVLRGIVRRVTLYCCSYRVTLFWSIYTSTAQRLTLDRPGNYTLGIRALTLPSGRRGTTL